MFDFGWPEILIIAIVLIVVVGPKDLPRVLRGLGSTTTKLRAMAGDFRKQFDEALREAELDEVKGLVDDARKLDPRRELKKHFDPLEKAGRDIRSGLDNTVKPKPTPPPTPPSAEAKPEVQAPRKEGAAALPGAKPVAAKQAPKTTKPAPKPAAEPAAKKSAAPKTPRKKGTAS